MNNQTIDQPINSSTMRVISFSQSEKISDVNQLLEVFCCDFLNGYYEPPIPYELLIKAKRSHTLHESAIEFKTNVFTSIFKKNDYLNIIDFRNFIADYNLLSNAYLIAEKNKLGRIIKFTHVLAKYVRRSEKNGQYLLLKNPFSNPIPLNNVLHFKGYDYDQNIYGTPSYLSGLLSIALNRESTMFRMKYYVNGSHAGYILVINGNPPPDAMDQIEAKLKESKGDNSFKNLLVQLPGGNKDSVQLIPISEVAAKDEFLNIKRATDDDISAVHRVPLALMSIAPKNAGGFGKPSEYAKVFYHNEIFPITLLLESLNEQVNVNLFQFNEYALSKEEST